MSKDKLTPMSMRLFFSELERLELKVNSFILMQDGEVEAQFWRKPYREGTQQLLFSLSKTLYIHSGRDRLG
ncbi:hypothetical protein [Paenibacillus sp. RC67]|uniref:hypothetical protein n=1 Tax=Paenibacillus sp. RC67 TaxID=3039392 RepID=UPI0024AD82EB|nr:hypothetical protein [Paenibacillus sp. RC67]